MAKLLLLLILFCLSISQTIAQQTEDRSLSQMLLELKKSKRDTSKLSLLNKIGQHYFSKSSSYYRENSFLDSSILFFQSAVTLGDSLNISNYAGARCLLGKAYIAKNNLAAGKKWFHDVIRHYHLSANKEKEAETWGLMGGSFARNKNNFNEIVTAFEKAIALFKELGNREKEAGIRIQLADLYYVRGKLALAEHELLDVLNTYHSIGFKKTFNAYYLLSVVNRYQGDFNKSLLYSTKCLENIRETQDTSHANYFYGELALVYQELDRLEESVYWFKKTLNVREKIKASKVSIYRTADLLLQQLLKQKKTSEAFDLVLRLKKEYPPLHSLEKASFAQCMARCYDTRKNYGQAEKYYLEMLREYKNIDSSFDITEYESIANHDIGRFYLGWHMYDKARYYLNNSLTQKSESFATSREKDIHLMLFFADSATGNYLSAINHLRQHKVINDSIFSEKKSDQLEELQIQYQTADKENQILLLNNKSKIQQAELQQSALVRKFMITGIILVSVFFYYRYYQKQESNKQLEIKQTEINSKNEFLKHLIKEKDWLVKEIHHRVKNNFHTVIGLLGTQSEYLKNEDAIFAIENSKHRINAMALIHQKLYQSENFSATSMPDYIHELVAYLKDSFGIKLNIRFEIQIEFIEMDLPHAMPIGLILNEAITNSIKHAFVNKPEGLITVSMSRISDKQLLLMVSDNGIGLPLDFDIEKTSSMGMNLLKGLSEDIEGVFSIVSSYGTCLTLIFPYEPEIYLISAETISNQAHLV